VNPETAKTVADFLTADFEYEMQTTLRVLAAAPDNHLDYRPDSMSKTALGLLRHLANEDAWILNSIADGAFNQPPDEEASGINTSADAVAYYKEKVPAALARVKAMSPEKLAGIIDLMGMIQMPAVNMISLAMKHSVHHRGQLSSYLRAMGGKVPGIYGPSADTQAEAAGA
jgi:uncharacterized damage-inducible protein DinB